MIYFLFNSANLICRGTDISTCFRESLGLPYNESPLYFVIVMYVNGLNIIGVISLMANVNEQLATSTCVACIHCTAIPPNIFLCCSKGEHIVAALSVRQFDHPSIRPSRFCLENIFKSI